MTEDGLGLQVDRAPYRIHKMILDVRIGMESVKDPEMYE